MIWKDDKECIKEEPFKYNGIDRINNSKGYTIDNCVPCCFMCNYSKNNHSLSDWKAWLERLKKNLHRF